MRYKKLKIFLASQHEKEEKWLNEMANMGFAMVSITGGIFYEFEKCEPGEYIYRLELLEHHALSLESMKYIQFVEDTGAEMMGYWLSWVYFRKKAREGEFNLFSDIDSKVRHFKRIRRFLLPILIMQLSIASSHVISFIRQFINNKNFTFVSSYYNGNLYSTVLIFLICILFLFVYVSLHQQLKKLKKEQIIRE